MFVAFVFFSLFFNIFVCLRRFGNKGVFSLEIGGSLSIYLYIYIYLIDK